MPLADEKPPQWFQPDGMESYSPLTYLGVEVEGGRGGEGGGVGALASLYPLLPYMPPSVRASTYLPKYAVW